LRVGGGDVHRQLPTEGAKLFLVTARLERHDDADASKP
jgi:hypothetical protein